MRWPLRGCERPCRRPFSGIKMTLRAVHPLRHQMPIWPGVHHRCWQSALLQRFRRLMGGLWSLLLGRPSSVLRLCSLGHLRRVNKMSRCWEVQGLHGLSSKPH